MASPQSPWHLSFTCIGPCLSSLAAADIIFQRVLHDTDYGGKKLTYDFFCKALCLVAADVYPDLDWESVALASKDGPCGWQGLVWLCTWGIGIPSKQGDAKHIHVF